MVRPPTIFLLASFLTTSASAQIAFGGHPYGDKAEKRGMPPAVAVHLPTIDVPALMDEDAARAAQGIKGPFRFGFTHATGYTLDNSGSWWTMPNGDRVWRLKLHCPDALGINLQFSNYVVPDGARMFLYNEAGEVRGGYTAQSNPGHTAFGTAPLSGDRITVEYIEPASLAGQGQLTISGVTHEYRQFGSGPDRAFGDSGPCNVNTICPEGDDWRDEIRSVAHVVLGGGVCSGTLLNNCANDSTPYFLTANHCTEGNTTNASWVFIFNWESPTCDPTENASMDHTITGCEVLLENPPSDASFLRLSSIPPEEFQPYYSGWDMNGTPPDTVHCIHHPSGDIKKISSAFGPIDAQAAVDVGNGPADVWHIPQWASGTTEPGSSGSGLWNQDHRIIGQLYGGEAACDNSVNDFFGRFDVTGPLLAEWLGACGDSLDGFDPSAIVPVPIDVAITTISNVDRNVCGQDSIAPVVTLKNNGEAVLTFAYINYQVDGVLVGTEDWYGVLQPVQTVNVQLPVIHLTSGEHELRISTSAPNNGLDDDPLNDADSLTFIVNAPALVSTVELDLDHYGTETTWTLETQDGFVAYSGGPYENSPDGYTVNTDVCLAHMCYVLTVNDAVGDGMCCNYGNGDFRVLDSQGGVLLEGNGEFGFTQSDNFCVNWVGIGEAQASPMHIVPNPSTGRITVYLPDTRSNLHLRVQDALGRTVWTGEAATGLQQTALDLGHVAEGTYVLTAESDQERYVQRLVIQR
jgi:hypothetical protein